MMAKNILVVEDDLLIAAGIDSVLSDAGYSVVSATSGIEALNVTAEQEFDVAVMDIDLGGGIDGITTAQGINEISRTAIIFITKFTETPVFENAKRAFPVNFISKPFDDMQLLRAVDLAVSNLANTANNTVSEETREDSVFIASNNEGQYKRIFYKDIAYIQASRMYTNIYLDNRQSISIEKKTEKMETCIKVSMPSNQFTRQLKSTDIVRVSRSHYVNLRKVEGINGASLVLSNVEIIVKEEYKREVFKKLRIIRHVPRK